MFLSTDPAASTSISGTYTYGSANPLRYIDITGLFSWAEALVRIQDISGIVSDVAGVLAIVALATGVGAPVAAVLGGISIAAGAVHAGTKAIQAYNTCNGGKGSCGDAVGEALLSTAAIVPGGRLIKGAASGVKALGSAAKKGDDLVDVWRIVGPDEAAGIAKTGAYSVPKGGEGKYFFPSRAQAENLGKMYNDARWPGPQTLTRGQAPRSVIDRAEPVNAGTEGPAWFIRSPDIPSICNVQCLGIIK